MATELLPIRLNRRVDARDFGVVANGTTDDTEALQAAINHAVANRLILSAGGTMRITGPITVRTLTGRNLPSDAGLPEEAHIEWARGARLLVDADNVAGLILHGRGIRMTDIRVQYANFQPVANTGARGVVFKDLSFAQLGYIDVRGSNTGVTQDFQSGDNDYFYDNHIEAIRVLGFSNIGVAIRPLNEGNTPSVIHMISAIAPWVSGDDDLSITRSAGNVLKWQQGITKAVELRGSRGLKVGKINIESCAATECLLSLHDCGDVDIGTVHYEAVGLLANDAAFTKLFKSSAQIGCMSMYDFDMGSAAALSGSTYLFSVITNGFMDLNILELSGIRYSAGTNRMLVGQVGGHRLGRFVDNVSGGGTGETFIDANGRPTSLFTGSGRRLPMFSHANGLDIVPMFFARHSGGATRTTTGAIPVPIVHDTANGYAGGFYTVPVNGFYQFGAYVEAATGADCIASIRRNTSQVLATLSDLTNSGGVSQNGRLCGFYCSAGDVITLNLDSGSLKESTNVVFYGNFVSR